MMPQGLRRPLPSARRRAMRPMIRVFFGVALTVAAAACTAAGSSTIVGQPPGVTGEGGTVDMNPEGGSSVDPGTVDYSALFGPPSSTNATPGSINGLWAGSTSQYSDARLKLSDSQFLLANRCGSSSIVG